MTPQPDFTELRRLVDGFCGHENKDSVLLQAFYKNLILMGLADRGVKEPKDA